MGRRARPPVRPAPGRTEPEDWIYGIRPVLHWLEQSPEKVERIWVAVGREGGLGRLLRGAREAGVIVSHVPRGVLERMVPGARGHQGVVARVSALGYASLAQVMRRAAAAALPVAVWLDQVQDPHNVGAVARTLDALGAGGLVLGGVGAAGITPGAIKASAGSLATLPVARARKASELEVFRRSGFGVHVLVPKGGRPPWEVDLQGRHLFVAGPEGKPIRRSLLERADGALTLPLAGGVESLNLSVSVAMVLAEALRQVGRGGPGKVERG